MQHGTCGHGQDTFRLAMLSAKCVINERFGFRFASVRDSFSSLTLLVERQEGHPARKNE